MRRTQHSRQVFGLTGTRREIDSNAPNLLAVASQACAHSADDGGRSCSPLRDSPGFSPGSLSFDPRWTELDTGVGSSGLLVTSPANQLRHNYKPARSNNA